MLHFYWQKKSESRPELFFDFEELEHVYELFGQLSELEGEIDELPVESNLKKLLDTLKYYIALTDLSEAQREILDLKINKVKNQDIADVVNKKYGKSYTANYISTIFRQKIIPRINESAQFHAQIVENICFEENFKKCNENTFPINRFFSYGNICRLKIIINICNSFSNFINNSFCHNE